MRDVSNRYIAGLLCIGATAVFLMPLAIDSKHVTTRAIACFICADYALKWLDLARELRITRRSIPSLNEFLIALVPIPVLLVVWKRRVRQSMKASELPTVLPKLFIGASLFIAAFVLLYRLHFVTFLQEHFLVDHVLKIFIFLFLIEVSSHLEYALTRLTSFRWYPFMDAPFRSQTVGEFWTRYNCRIHDWLDVNVFRLTGGIRHPVRSTLYAFLASGILHEAAFGIATSRWDGYQFMFFTLQAPAAYTSRWIDKRLTLFGFWGECLSRAFTWLWLGSSSMLFFHGIHRVLPFYYAAKPWLP